MRNAQYARDEAPIVENCDCAACREGFSRAYVRHLFAVGEMLGPILVSLHNIRHFQRFMADVRHTIADADWAGLLERWPVAAGPSSDSGPAGE